MSQVAMQAPSFLMRIHSVDVTDLRFIFLIAAVLVYAFAGSPTPNQPAWPEFFVAVFLFFAAGLPSIYSIFIFDIHAPLWKKTGQVFLIYGLSFCVIAGVVQGHESVQIIRDLLPFMFMFLPLFMYDIFKKNPEFLGIFAGILVLQGFVFSLRAAPEIMNWWSPGFFEQSELYYFANSPCVLFAVTFLMGFGVSKFIDDFSVRGIFILCACLIFALIPFAAIAMTLQRASIGFVIIYSLVLFFLALYGHTLRTVGLMFLLTIFLLPFSGFFEMISDFLMTKTGQVGLNMRGAEFGAVLDEISRSPLSLFFGTGWGGTFESPAVAGVRVNYTHSLVSGVFLKTGLTGLTLLVFYLAGMLGLFLRALKRNEVLALALAGPVLIDVFLYASHKSLDFGLILLLLCAAGSYGKGQKVASLPRLLYSKPYIF